MQNKIKLFGLLFGIFTLCVMPVMSYAAGDDDFEELVEEDSFDYLTDDAANDLSAMSVANYDVDGSVFQKITDLEQQKVLMELEKERAQLDLDLDRLAAEKIKLQMEDKLSKKFYKIGDVAEILDIPTSTLRFWEKEFTIIKPKRNAKNVRVYTVKDIESIKMIYYLVREKGLKLDAAQAMIKRNRDGISKQFEVVERLKKMREQLLQLDGALSSIEAYK